MNILLHVCCGPCTTYTLDKMRSENIDVKGFFYNPNIHPYKEFKKRIKALVDFSEQSNFDIEINRNYGLTDFLRKVIYHEQKRCNICYQMRLEKTAEYAVKIGADAFSSTLLYSKYQKHEQIYNIGNNIAEKYQIPFYYKDFRDGWQQGIDKAIKMGLYRQAWCGCVYSEQERYDKKFKKNR